MGDLAEFEREWTELLNEVRVGISVGDVTFDGKKLPAYRTFDKSQKETDPDKMLGRTISDHEGVEGPPGEAAGLGLLDLETVLTADKVLRPTRGRLASGAVFEGYEIHVGRTTGAGLPRVASVPASNSTAYRAPARAKTRWPGGRWRSCPGTGAITGTRRPIRSITSCTNSTSVGDRTNDSALDARIGLIRATAGAGDAPASTSLRPRLC